MSDDVQGLRQEMAAGFEAMRDAMRERFDDQKELSAARHTENVTRLTTIEAEVKKTNGRVTRAEEQIKTLFRDGRAKIVAPISGISRRDVQMIVYGGGGVIAGWKFVEYAIHLFQQAHP